MRRVRCLIIVKANFFDFNIMLTLMSQLEKIVKMNDHRIPIAPPNAVFDFSLTMPVRLRRRPILFEKLLQL